jgi:hypothetical protein
LALGESNSKTIESCPKDSLAIRQDRTNPYRGMLTTFFVSMPLKTVWIIHTLLAYQSVTIKKYVKINKSNHAVKSLIAKITPIAKKNHFIQSPQTILDAKPSTDKSYPLG